MSEGGGSIGRTFILVISFLGLFAILTNDMPAVFLYGGDRVELVYEDWQAARLFMANVTQYANVTISRGSVAVIYQADWIPEDNYGVDLRMSWYAHPPLHNETWWQRWWWVIYPIWWDYVEIAPYPLTNDTIISHVDSIDQNLTDTFVMSCEAYSYYVNMGFNSSVYANWTAVFADPDAEMQAYVAMGYEDTPSTISAWNIVSRLLFFQVPEIHVVVNAIIALPIYACIGYLAYRFILWAIPFLGG